MKRGRGAVLAVLLVALAIVAAGCGSGDSSSAPQDASAELETLISHQLPRRVRALSGPSAFVTGVRCVHQAGSSYQCIATVEGTNAYSGAYEKTQLPIEGTCDERSCIWKVSP
jgi:hypothetical protein